MCLECLDRCQATGAIDLVKSANSSKKLSGWLVPALIIGMTGVGIVGADLIKIPSITRSYSKTDINAPSVRKTVFVVDGVRCVDTARVAAEQLKEVKGTIELTAYAASGRLEIIFDSLITDIPSLQKAIEDPLYDEIKDRYIFNRYKVIDIDGRSILRE